MNEPSTTDQQIRELHEQASALWPELERIIDELKALGPHTMDGDNALTNVRTWLVQLSRR